MWRIESVRASPLLLRSPFGSLAIGWTGAATGFAILYCARIVLGLAEGPSFPAHARIVERWLPPEERATAVGSALVAIPVALAVGAPLATYLIAEIGWRAMFFVLAAAGVLWLPAWLYFCSDFPWQSRFVNQAERDHIGGQDDKAQAAAGEAATDWRFSTDHPDPGRRILVLFRVRISVVLRHDLAAGVPAHDLSSRSQADRLGRRPSPGRWPRSRFMDAGACRTG